MNNSESNTLEIANGVVFLQDNARPRVAGVTRKKLEEIGWEVLYHPPYSPDISPSDFHLFLALDNFIKAQKQEIADVNMMLQSFLSRKIKIFIREVF